jgi:hypothetical protein
MHKALTILTLALLTVSTASRAQYHTSVQKADSLFFRGEFANSSATYYNLANAYAYLIKDSEQAKAYYQRFLELAHKEENPNAQLLEMMKNAEEMLKKGL